MRTLTKHEIRCYRSWYSDARELLAREYGEDAELVAGLLAATSPRMKVKKNWKAALAIYRSWKAGGLINYGESMRTHRPNIDRALAGESLSGLKVESFRQNLTGSDNEVTIDVWMLRWFGCESKHTTPKQYKNLAGRCRRHAKKYELSPAEYQAVAWSACRADAGKHPKSFASIWRNLSAQMLLWDEENF